MCAKSSKLTMLSGILSLCMTGYCVDWAVVNEESRAEALTAVRPGEPGKRPFWTVHSRAFIHPPAFEFADMPTVTRYRYTATEIPEGKRHQFESDHPWRPLTPVFGGIRPGYVLLVVEGLDDRNLTVGLAGSRYFYRAARFHGPYPTVNRDYAATAFAFVDEGPFRTWNWDGQFEDMDPMPPYVDLTAVRACCFSSMLFASGRTADARETLAWCEDQFVVWSDPLHHKDWTHWKMPTALEQYDFYTPIDGSMANFIKAFVAAWQATGEALYLEKAKALADCIVRNQRSDGTISTYFDETGRTDWVNCMVHSAESLMTLADAIKGCLR